MKITYEEPSCQHERIQSEIMEADTRAKNKERFDDGILLTGTPEEQVTELLYAIQTYEKDLAFYRRRTQELEQKITALTK